MDTPIDEGVMPADGKNNDPVGYLDDPQYMEKIEVAPTVATLPLCKSSVDQLNQRLAVVNVAGKTMIVEQKRDPVTGYVHDEFSTTENVSKYLKNQLATNNKGEVIRDRGREVHAFEEWMSSPKRNTYSSICFKPEPGTYAADFPRFSDGHSYNQYKGLHTKPAKGSCEKIETHIRDIWCAGRAGRFEYVWNWFARMVQKPQERGETAIILRSGEGTGKNIIADIFVEFLGIHGMMVSSPEHLVGRFTGHQRLLVFLFANEAVWGGDKKIEGILKSFITDEYRTTEEKFLPAITERNYMHLLLATNSDWAAPMGLDDRRYLVLDVDESKKGDQEYFKALRHEIGNGGKAALLHDLLETDISNFDHRTLPRDQGASKLIDQLKTADPITRWWFQVLSDGALEYRDFGSNENLVVFGSKDWDCVQINVEKRELHNCYLAYCETHKIHFIKDKAIFMRTLYQQFNIGADKTFSTIRVLDGKNIRVYKILISKLDAARSLFQRAAGNQTIDWDGIP
jgi:hypothetical protein